MTLTYLHILCLNDPNSHQTHSRFNAYHTSPTFLGCSSKTNCYNQAYIVAQSFNDKEATYTCILGIINQSIQNELHVYTSNETKSMMKCCLNMGLNLKSLKCFTRMTLLGKALRPGIGVL